MEKAFNWNIKNDGEAFTEDYPYSGIPFKSCRTKTEDIAHYEHITRFEQGTTPEALTDFANQGPVAVAVNANSAWQSYTGGVVSAAECPTDGSLNHGVVLAGYTADYWLIKNSWGRRWGEAGYMRLERHPTDELQNACGITTDTAFPYFE